MAKKPLTPAQIEAMNVLSHYVGQTVDVLTGEPPRHLPAVAFACRTTAAALRGLEARGLITAKTYWRGAKVTVLQSTI